ncbi:MAG TPA: hypothetical protein VII30_08025, partial [Gemmatimonadaceae bacterium]
IWQWIVNCVDSWVREQLLIGSASTPDTSVFREPNGLGPISARDRSHFYRAGSSNARNEGSRNIGRAEDAHSKTRRWKFLHWSSFVTEQSRERI